MKENIKDACACKNQAKQQFYEDITERLKKVKTYRLNKCTGEKY